MSFIQAPNLRILLTLESYKTELFSGSNKCNVRMIPFNVPTISGTELEYLSEIVNNPSYFTTRYFTKKCQRRFQQIYSNGTVLLTNSGTHSLEFAALLLDIQPGDEIIMPSFNFVGTANAFVLRGGIPVFVDIRPDTMNINEQLIEEAITHRTKAIVLVYYAGVGCEIDTIIKIAQKYNLKVVEDNAQGYLSKYKGEYLGSLGDLSCTSFHLTKNLNCGEGGILVINNPNLVNNAELIYEFGTNRSQFLRGEIESYTWKRLGSKYYPSDLTAAFLYAQLEHVESILTTRRNKWDFYYQNLRELEAKGCLQLPIIPKHCEHNGHIFYFKLSDEKERNTLMTHLKKQGIMATFHYVPLHSSEFGKKVGRFSGEDIYTTKESERLLRLPLYHSLKTRDQSQIIEAITDFF